MNWSRLVDEPQPAGDAVTITTFLFSGPAPPGVPRLWQATHEVSLYTGPRPSPPWPRGSSESHSRANRTSPRPASPSEEPLGRAGAGTAAGFTSTLFANAGETRPAPVPASKARTGVGPGPADGSAGAAGIGAASIGPLTPAGGDGSDPGSGVSGSGRAGFEAGAAGCSRGGFGGCCAAATRGPRWPTVQNAAAMPAVTIRPRATLAVVTAMARSTCSARAATAGDATPAAAPAPAPNPSAAWTVAWTSGVGMAAVAASPRSSTPSTPAVGASPRRIRRTRSRCRARWSRTPMVASGQERRRAAS